MPIVVLLVVVATIGAAVVVLAGRRGGDVDFPPDRPNFALPERELQRADVDGVRFAVGLRGYRMDQVDIVMDRLAAELADRDAQIAGLRGTAAEPVVGAHTDTPDDDGVVDDTADGRLVEPVVASDGDRG